MGDLVAFGGLTSVLVVNEAVGDTKIAANRTTALKM